MIISRIIVIGEFLLSHSPSIVKVAVKSFAGAL